MNLELKIFRNWGGFILLLLLSIIPLFNLFHAGLPITHDGQDHVARIANFYQNLLEGNFIPRWAGNLNWGYGHPILMFLYPLPSYLASIFHFLGFTLVDSVKLVFGLAFVLSGITMYLWIRNVLGEYAGVIAGVLYMFAPYRFVDLYVRGAIGEHVAFTFPPLILYFLLKLSNRYSYWYLIGGVLSFAGLVLSHNAITIMFIPIIFLYGSYLVWLDKNKKNLILQYISILILGFGLSAFFIIPAFLEGRYTLRDVVTKNEYATRFVENPVKFLYSPWNYGGTGQFSVQIGFVQIIGIILSLIWVFQKKKTIKNQKLFYAIIFLSFASSLSLMLKESNIMWKIITTLQKFQFPWRFLSVTVFCAAVLSSFSALLFAKRKLIFMALIILFALLLSSNQWKANDFLKKPENFFTGIYHGTTDTGESSPIWSVRFMEKEPKALAEIIEGKATISKNARTNIEHIYSVRIESDKARIRENTLYFPGWKVYVDGKETSIEFQDSKNRGLITFFASQGIHNVEVKFGDTKLRKMANLISLMSIGVIVGAMLIAASAKLKFKKTF